MPNETKILCRSCGREIAIPAELEEFSCVYCGARLNRESFRQPAEAAIPPELGRLLKGRMGLLGSFDKAKYSGAFKAYAAESRPILEPLLCRNGEHIRRAAVILVDAFEEGLRADPRFGSRARRGSLMMEARMLLAVWFSPMVTYQQLPAGAAFNEVVREEWRGRYPSEDYEFGEYEAIDAEFRRKFKWLGGLFSR